MSGNHLLNTEFDVHSTGVTDGGGHVLAIRLLVCPSAQGRVGQKQVSCVGQRAPARTGAGGQGCSSGTVLWTTVFLITFGSF